MLITKAITTALFLSILLFQSGTGYKVVGRYPIGGTGGWDYINIDSSARRLYVSHSTQVEVVDADTGKMVGTIADTPGVHGAAIAAGFKHGFTSNGREHKVSMFAVRASAHIDLFYELQRGRVKHRDFVLAAIAGEAVLESGSDRSTMNARRVGDRTDNLTSVDVDDFDLS